MLLTSNTPGVHVFEDTFGPIPIQVAGHRTMYLVGPALRGPLTPRLVTSGSGFHALYGKRSSITYLDEAVRAIFEITQVPVYVQRVVGAGAVVATKNLTKAGPTNVIKVDAKGPGADYNYVAGPPKKGVAVTYVSGVLKVYDYSVGTQPREIFYDVVKEKHAEKQQEINAASNLINITWLDTTSNPDNASADQGLATGADGATVDAAAIVGDETANPKTGIYGFADRSFEPGFIMAPGFPQQVVGLALLDLATRFRKVAIIDSSFGIGSNVQSLITEKQQYASDQGFAIYCAQWLKTLDIDTGAIKDVPRSPYRAAHIAYSHQFKGGIANVGAGVKFVYPNVVGLEFDFNDTDHDELNRNGVDIPRNFARFNRGLVSFSGRSVSANILYRFNSVRVIFNTLGASLERALLDEVFEVIDGEGRQSGKVRARIEQLLYTLWQEGVLFGKNPTDAYKVVAQTNNLVLLDQGILGFEVYAKPSPVAERIKVTMFRTALSVNLQNNTVFVGDIAVS